MFAAPSVEAFLQEARQVGSSFADAAEAAWKITKCGWGVSPLGCASTCNWQLLAQLQDLDDGSPLTVQVLDGGIAHSTKQLPASLRLHTSSTSAGRQKQPAMMDWCAAICCTGCPAVPLL